MQMGHSRCRLLMLLRDPDGITQLAIQWPNGSQSDLMPTDPKLQIESNATSVQHKRDIMLVA